MTLKPEGSVVGTSFRRTLDAESRLRLQIFSFKLLALIPLSAALAIHRGFPLLATIGFFCFWNSIFAGLAAMLRWQRFGAPFLTAWDETAAFLAIALLTRLLDASAA